MPTPRRPPIDAEVLRTARLAKGMTLEEVQMQCAIRGQAVFNLSRMESGELRWPSPHRLAVLAEVLGLEVSDLLTKAAA